MTRTRGPHPPETDSVAPGALVFAYGSNMHLPHVRSWAEARQHPRPQLRALGRAELRGHRLCWNYRSRWRPGGAANVESASKSSVHGVLLEVNPETLAILDQKEGHPIRYRRQLLSVYTADQRPHQAWVYQVTKPYQEEETVAPSKTYLGLLRKGGLAHHLPHQYLEELRWERFVLDEKRHVG